jgi:hypothetical protein
VVGWEAHATRVLVDVGYAQTMPGTKHHPEKTVTARQSAYLLAFGLGYTRCREASYIAVLA